MEREETIQPWREGNLNALAADSDSSVVQQYMNPSVIVWVSKLQQDFI